MKNKTIFCTCLLLLAATLLWAGDLPKKKRTDKKHHSSAKNHQEKKMYACPDLYIPDGPDDTGVQPYTGSTDVYASPSITIIQPGSGTPGGNATPGVINRVCIKVKNATPTVIPLGCCLKVCLYWANASLGLNWPDPWDGVKKACIPPVPIGGLVGCMPLRGDVIDQEVCMDWLAPDPSSYKCCSQPQHFCLVARIISCTDDEYAPKPGEGSDIGNNARNLNDVSWRNVTVVKPVVGETMSGCLHVSMKKAITPVFAINMLAANPDIFRFTRPRLALGEDLTAQWIQNGMPGNNVTLVKAEDGTYLIEAIGPDAVIKGLLVPDVGLERAIGVEFEFIDKGPDGQQMDFNIEAIDEGTGRLLGGEQYQLQFGDQKTRAIPNADNRPTIALGRREETGSGAALSRSLKIMVSDKTVNIIAPAGRDWELTVMDEMGRVVHRASLKGRQPVNLDKLRTGIYLLLVTDAKTKESATRKVVIR